MSDKKELIRKLDEDILNEIEDEEQIEQDIFQAGEVGESINRTIVKIDNVLKFSITEQNNVSTPGGLGSSDSSEPSKCTPQQQEQNCQNYP